MPDLTVRAMQEAARKLKNDAVAHKRAEREHRRRARQARSMLARLHRECAELGIELVDDTAESQGGQSDEPARRAGNS